jgi:hypothetical protein
MSEHLDFKLYLDAATQSVTRTRNSIYLLLTVFVAVLAVYVNTTVLDWSGKRVQRMRRAYECVTKPNLPADQCKDAMRYAGDLGLPTDQSVDTDLYKEYRNAMIRRRTDLRTIQLPLFGAVLDLNDLGLLSAILFVILLMILRANLYHELDSLESAREKVEAFKSAGNDDLYQESNEMLTRVQVLASPRKDNQGYRWSAMVVMTVPIFLHVMIVRRDWATLTTAYDLIGSKAAKILWAIEVLGWIAMILLWYSNARVWVKLAYLFHIKDTPRWLHRVMRLSAIGQRD